MSSKSLNPKDAVGIRKAALSVVPMNVVVEAGVGMMEGAAKYGRHNYRASPSRCSVYFDATMRHLLAFWEGEDLDPDSRLSHLTKAMCSLMVWRDAQVRGHLIDDRPPRSAPFDPALNKLAGEIIDRHADKSPKHYTLEDDAKTRDDVPPVDREEAAAAASSREDGQPVPFGDAGQLVQRTCFGLVGGVQVDPQGPEVLDDPPRVDGGAAPLARPTPAGGEEGRGDPGLASRRNAVHERFMAYANLDK